MEEEDGIRRMLWLSHDLDSLAEETRQSLGFSRSGFYRYALVRLLQDLSVLSGKVKRQAGSAKKKEGSK